MAISINNSANLLMIQQALANANNALSKNFQRLSSGVKINSAGDGSSALATAMRLSTQVSGMDMATKNANDALSLVQVADTALSETAGALQQVRNLALVATSGTASSTDRAILSADVKGLIYEISHIATSTNTFGQTLLNGDFAIGVQVGANPGQNVAIALGGASLQQLGLGVSGSKLNVSTVGSASAAIATVDAALQSVSVLRASLGSMQNRLAGIVQALGVTSLGYNSARSSLMDTDYATESASLMRNNIQRQVSLAMLAQANMQSQMLLKLLDSAGSSNGYGHSNSYSQSNSNNG